ncbi:Acsf3 [Symbiodinium sp. CCMP2592]|nr:Acsf3 [Symbiodinium sp. CCMP2592]
MNAGMLTAPSAPTFHRLPQTPVAAARVEHQALRWWHTPAVSFLASLTHAVWSKGLHRRSAGIARMGANTELRDFLMGNSPAAAPKSATTGLETAKQQTKQQTKQQAKQQAKQHLKDALLQPAEGQRKDASPKWAKLLDAFGNVDKNGDGHITKEELLKAVQGHGVTKEEIAEALDGCDLDHDGEINYAEFMKKDKVPFKHARCVLAGNAKLGRSGLSPGNVKCVKSDQATESKPGGARRPSAGFEVIPAVWKIEDKITKSSKKTRARKRNLLDAKHHAREYLDSSDKTRKFPYFVTSLLGAAFLVSALKDHAQAGQSLAVLEHGKAETVELSYSELRSNVQAISASIRALLSKKSEALPRHVAFFVHPSAAYVVTELSIWAADGVCVPLSVHSPVPELEYFVKDSESCLCLSDASGAPKMKEVAGKLSRPFAEIAKATESSKAYRLLVDGGPVSPAEQPGCFSCFCGLFSSRSDVLSQNALILYTSGTTGQPKGVVHTFNSLTAQMRSLSEAWKWSSKDRTLHVLPLHHIHGVQNILNTALFNGAAVELTAFDAAFCLKRLASGDITCFHAVPTVYVKFTQHLDSLPADARQAICRGLRNDSMRYMVSGSAALPVPTMKSWAEISGHVLLERYGMTEIGMALSNRVAGTRYPGCVGWPLPGVEVKQDQASTLPIEAPAIPAKNLQALRMQACAMQARAIQEDQVRFLVLVCRAWSPDRARV